MWAVLRFLTRTIGTGGDAGAAAVRQGPRGLLSDRRTVVRAPRSRTGRRVAVGAVVLASIPTAALAMPQSASGQAATGLATSAATVPDHAGTTLVAQAGPSGRLPLDAAAEAIAQRLFEEAARRGRPLSGRITPRPFVPAEIPLPAELADRLSDRVATRLGSLSRGRLGVVLPADLSQRVRELYQRLGPRNGSVEGELLRLLKDSGADFELIGRLTADGDGVSVAYRIVPTGVPELVADSDPIRLDPPAVVQGGRPTTFEAAVAAAAAYVADRLPGARALRLEPIAERISGFRGAFAQRLEDQLLVALQQARGSAVTGREVQRVLLADEPWPLGAGDRPAVQGPDDWSIVGTYRVQGDAVELLLRLRAGDGRTEAWSGVVLKAGLEIDDAGGRTPAFAPLRDDFAGPFGLRIASRRGAAPTYAIGERLSFELSVDRSADVHCFSIDADGVVVKLFPNRFLPQPALVGGRAMNLPDDLVPTGAPEGARIRWPAQEPPGPNLVKCWAVDPVGTGRLPPAIATASGPVPNIDPAALRRAFHGAAIDGRVSEASLVVSILARK
jgi:hypothetical protein